jgi:hypothetical protein
MNGLTEVAAEPLSIASTQAMPWTVSGSTRLTIVMGWLSADSDFAGATNPNSKISLETDNFISTNPAPPLLLAADEITRAAL